MTVAKWKEDLAAKDLLEQIGAKIVDCKMIPIGSVTISDSIVANTRATEDGLVSGETVERYAERMEAGDTFPSIVVQKDGRKYAILGGLHRLSAARQIDQAEILATIVNLESNLLSARHVRIALNARHGLPESISSLSRMVADLVLRDGLTTEAAAAIVGRSSSWVTRHIAGHKCAEEINERAKGEFNIESLPDKVIQALAYITNPGPRYIVAKFCFENQQAVTAKDFVSLISQVKSLEGESLYRRLREAKKALNPQNKTVDSDRTGQKKKRPSNMQELLLTYTGRLMMHLDKMGTNPLATLSETQYKCFTQQIDSLRDKVLAIREEYAASREKDYEESCRNGL